MLRIATNNLEAMSGSETGLIASRDAYGMGLQRSPIPSQPVNMRMSFSPDGGGGAGGAAIYKPIPVSASYEHQPAAAGGGDGFGQPQPASVGFNMNTTGGEPAKKKRGRPRKYGPDGTMALTVVPSAAPLSQSPSTVAVTQPSAVPSSTSPAAPRADSAQQQPSSSLKKARGRPPGSISKKQHQMEAPGSAGLGFTPHVITVKAGEDVSSKIMAFSQNGPRAVCILSANGAISNVTLRQPATSGGSVTYEGRFEILSLSGSFMLSENGGQRSRTGGLSVSLAGPDGRVLGGGVGGLLTAASPVQVVVGSFIADGGSKELKTANQVESFYGTATLHPPGSGVAAANSPPSHGTLSESSGGPGSPGNHSTEVYNNANQQGMSGIPWK